MFKLVFLVVVVAVVIDLNTVDGKFWDFCLFEKKIIIFLFKNQNNPLKIRIISIIN